MRRSPTTERRSDYASTRVRTNGAWIERVEEGSPAWEAGLEAGMRIDAVFGKPLRDIIDWRWEADGSWAELDVYVPDENETYSCTLEREPGQDWGVEFTDIVFDGMRTCVNACQFCFMAMLPKEARPSLTLRDDDYRLSFLQGNFVTLTNLTDEEVERIIELRLEPMNVSIHAVTPEVRIPLIGRHAMRGMEVLERLCAADIEIHGQVVLCAGINDGEELERTLAWVERHPQVRSLALVPLGYTKYSKRFSSSYSEDREASRAVVRMLEPYQKRARATLGITRFQLSDEFYLDAELPIPAAETYDGYPQFFDGIGMLRSFIDECALVAHDRTQELESVRSALLDEDLEVLLVCGEAASGVFSEFSTLLGQRCAVCAIRNDYYGGDVNVTGLIVACDLVAQLPAELGRVVVVLPEVMFNFDRVTLDGVTLQELFDEIRARKGRPTIAVASPERLLDAVEEAVLS